MWVAAALSLTAVGDASAQTQAGAVAQVISPGSVRPTDAEREPGTLPNRLQGRVGVIERLGERVDATVAFTDETGRRVQLADYLGDGKPVILAFVYHRCPMLCGLILDGVAEAVENTTLLPGEDYEVLVISFDPQDTPQLAAAKKDSVFSQVEAPGVMEATHFLTGGEDSIRRLTKDTGFGFAYDATTGEYAHNAALIFLSPSGTVARYLYGVQFPSRDFRLATVEAGEGTVGSSVDRFLLTCYQFDPDARSYSLIATQLLKWGAGFMLLLVGGLLFVLWRADVIGRADPDDVPIDAGAPDGGPYLPEDISPSADS